MLLKDFYSVGWDSQNQIHSAVKNSINARMLESADSDLRRFATTVMHQMDYANAKTKQMRLQLGQRESANISSVGTKDIDHIHRKYKDEIEAQHLAKPDFTPEELSDFLFEEGLSSVPGLLDLLTKETHKELKIRL